MIRAYDDNGNVADLVEWEKKIVKETLNKVWKKAISMHDDYVELEELDNYIDEIMSEMDKLKGGAE